MAFPLISRANHADPHSLVGSTTVELAVLNRVEAAADSIATGRKKA